MRGVVPILAVAAAVAETAQLPVRRQLQDKVTREEQEAETVVAEAAALVLLAPMIQQDLALAEREAQGFHQASLGRLLLGVAAEAPEVTPFLMVALVAVVMEWVELLLVVLAPLTRAVVVVVEPLAMVTLVEAGL